MSSVCPPLVVHRTNAKHCAEVLPPWERRYLATFAPWEGQPGAPVSGTKLGSSPPHVYIVHSGTKYPFPPPLVLVTSVLGACLPVGCLNPSIPPTSPTASLIITLTKPHHRPAKANTLNLSSICHPPNTNTTKITSTGRHTHKRRDNESKRRR